MNVDECRPSRAVPVLHFHGTADRHVPFGGGFGDQSIAGVAFASVRKSIDFWRAQGRCADTPIVTEFPDRAGDGTRATRTAWTGCAGGGEVALVTIEGGGHTWPGVPTRLRRGLGVATANLSASEMMWEFFRRHPLP
jgi:polyhydroxybutyrate depolymerase